MNKNGTAPVHLIYQISGQRKYYSIPDSGLLPINWNADEQKAIYLDKKTAKPLLNQVDVSLLLSNQEVIEFNQNLEALEIKVKSLENDFTDRGITFSAQMIVDRLKGSSRLDTKLDASSSALFDFMEKYIADHTASREPGSLSVYKSLKNHLLSYQKATGKKVTFENIDYSFFQAFQNFLLTPRQVFFPSKAKNAEPGAGAWNEVSLNNTTVAKQLSTIKTFLNYARKRGITVSDKYKDFTIKKENLEVIALTSQEFESLFNLDLSTNKRLDQVRDIFCFACSTGLRYSDLDQLKRENIKSDEIRIIVKKTKEPLSIPLNPFSVAILDKYKEHLQPLPMITNQRLNDYIKELCMIAGIDEKIEIVRFKGVKREATIHPKYELIGVHTGRKTFATLSLEKGMSAEEVMTITGHRDYKSFKRYVKVTEARKKVVMAKAWGTVKKSNLKAVS